MNSTPRKLLCCGLFVALSLILAARAPAAESTNLLRFPVGRFSIAPLEGTPGESIQQPLIMCLPAKQGFAANVNVQVQPFGGGLEEYKDITMKQFKDRDLKVITAKLVGNSELLLEYSGQFQAHELHWYARALKSGEHVYLVTATGLEDQWAEQGTQLKHCVDSFKCEGAASPSSTR